MTRVQRDQGMGFFFVRGNEESGGSIYEAKFQLPDDGMPDSEQYLFVTVEVNAPGSDNLIGVRLEVGSKWMETKGKRVRIGEFSTGDVDAVGRLLYGAARVVTSKSIIPV